MAEIRYPKITEATTEGQLRQMKDYMFQLTNQLNFALKATDEKIEEYNVSLHGGGSSVEKTSIATGDTSQKSAEEVFGNLKSLIIKSADIVEAYSEVIEEKLSGKYVAVSDFGDYQKDVEATYMKTPENSTEFYDSVQSIVSQEIGGISEIRSEFYIKTGWLDNGNTIGGVEIGLSKTTDDGTDKGFARFTTGALTFYDGGGFEDRNRLAVFSPSGNIFTYTRFTGDVEMGGYLLDTSNGIAFKWTE